MEKLLHGDSPLRLRAKESVTFFLSHHALHVNSVDVRADVFSFELGHEGKQKSMQVLTAAY